MSGARSWYIIQGGRQREGLIYCFVESCDRLPAKTIRIVRRTGWSNEMVLKKKRFGKLHVYQVYVVHLGWVKLSRRFLPGFSEVASTNQGGHPGRDILVMYLIIAASYRIIFF